MAVTTLTDTLDKLAAFDPAPFPVLSLYLNTQANQHGRDSFAPFVRKEFRARARTYPARSIERESFERDAERITQYLQSELRPSANGLAIFACAGADDFFEAVQLDAPIRGHSLHIGPRPHLYPLARLTDQYRPYAALVADTNAARLFVFGFGRRLDQQEVSGVKTTHSSQGGWSQSRYQRHIDNYRHQHAKEVVDALERVVRDDQVEHIILAGDEVILPLLREHFTPLINERVIDVLRLDITTPENEVLAATLEAMRQHDAKTDAEKVDRMLGEYRGGGLAVVGGDDVLKALTVGQVDELLLSATLDTVPRNDTTEEAGGADPGTSPGGQAGEVQVAGGTLPVDDLVTLARQTSARITFIEDPALLADVGGVGALLRFRIEGTSKGTIEGDTPIPTEPSHEQQEQRQS